MALQDAAIAKIEQICKDHENDRTPLLMILCDIQHEFGYVPLEAQKIVATMTGESEAKVFSIVSFYSFFSHEPKGKYVIGFCTGTCCYVKGGRQILDKLTELLNIKPGETTKDGLFTLDTVRCIGSCGKAPAFSINGKVYSNLKLADVDDIIAHYRKLGGDS